MLTKDADVLIVYKQFKFTNSAGSHAGLGVAALNNQKVLRALGLRVDVEPTGDAAAIVASLERHPRTHLVISAPWVPTALLSNLCAQYPETQFYVVSHSNVSFLSADRDGVKLLRDAMNLETGTHNFHVAGNCEKFSHWLRAAFGVPCAVMPNNYYLDSHIRPPHGHEPSTGTLRIGAFGATRTLKNLMGAAGAALEIARDLRRPLEFWISGGRVEGGEAGVVLGAVQNLLYNVPGVKLMLNTWQSWPEFRQVIGQMHLLLQPSYTESFNMVTADGVVQGVPSVVSEAIDWVPDSWKADSDDVLDIAQHGKQLLRDRDAAREGLRALIRHNQSGTRSWARSLGITDLPEYHLPHPVGESLIV